MKQGFKDIAQRLANADQNFVDNVVETFGTTVAEAEKVLRVFKKAKAVKRNVAMGRYDLTHGAFWEADVIARTLQVVE